jgi:hypothetical protein
MRATARVLSIGSIGSAALAGSFLHPVLTGQVDATTNHGDPIGTGLVAAAIAFTAVALLLGVLAYSPGSLRKVPSALRTIAPRPSSVAGVFAALLIVSAAAGGGALGPDAQRAYEQGHPVDRAEAIACGGVCIAAGVGIAVGFGAGYVTNEYLSGDSTDDLYTQAETEETHLQTDSHLDSIGRADLTLNTVMSNQVNDGSRSIAWHKAKAAAIREMNNGSTEAETRDAAVQAVTDYYSTMEMNLLNSKSESVRRAEHIDEVFRDDPGTGVQYVAGSRVTDGYENPELVYADYTLRNGTVVNRTVGLHWPTYDKDFYYVEKGDISNRTASASMTESKLLFDSHANFTPSRPDYQDDTRWGRAMLGGNSQTLFNDIHSANDSMVANAETWVNNTYSQYSAGEIDESEIVDPTTLAQEFSTDYNSTGYYGYAAASLAIQGTNGTLNQSMVFDLHNGSAGRTANETYNGTLFTDWSPSSTNGSFVTGNTYDTANANTLVYVATNDGLRVVEGQFHIVSMTNVKTGEAVNSTQLENYNRQTADAGWNETQYQQLLDLQKQLNDQQAAAAGGSGSQELLLIALAAGALALLMRREGH